MKHFYSNLAKLLFVVCCLWSIQGSAQLVVNNAASATQLANKIVGPGVTVSNVSVQKAPGGTGIFTGGNTTNIGLTDGILLTTGDANDAKGPNTAGATSKDKADFTDDPDLDNMTNYSIRDQSILKFDFVATSNFINVQYVFASEAYNELVCTQYSDVLGFFVTGPNPGGGNYVAQNIAIVPGSFPQLPVSINSINNGTPGSSGGSAGNCQSLAYSSYYNDNNSGTTIGYDGFTDVLSSQVAIVPGQTYTFKFAIADVSNNKYDSGVFIKGKSFSVYSCHAGELALSGQPNLCLDDEVADVFQVITNSLAIGDTYNYILTSSSGTILAFNSTGIFDAESLPAGNYKIYGLSYGGVITGLSLGGNVSDISADPNSGCFELTAPVAVSRIECCEITCPEDISLPAGSAITPEITGTPARACDPDWTYTDSDCPYALGENEGQVCFVGVNNPVGATSKYVVDYAVNNGDGTVTIRTTLSRNFVDNTYGTNAIGWPNGHTFSNLTGSDQLQLALYDGSNTKKLEFKMDYISSSGLAPSGYKSLGVAGGDGGMIVGSSSNILNVVTSLDANFNQYGYVLTTNSPVTDANYTPNATYPNWIYDVWYEVTVKLSAFGANGFGSVDITGIHASPSKTGNNTELVTETPCPDPCDDYHNSLCSQSYFRHWTSTLTGRTCDQVITVANDDCCDITCPEDITVPFGTSITPDVTGTPARECDPDWTYTDTDCPEGPNENEGQICFEGVNNPVGATSQYSIDYLVNNGDGTVTIRTTLSTNFVDNTYGTNAIGWPNGHTFSNLTGSDQLQLALYDAANVKKLEFKMDYISSSSAAPSGYKSLGVTGGDGGMLVGSASNILNVVTSLDANFNQYGYVLTSNSPATDANYTPNATYPNWIYEVWYEVKVKLSAFGANGFGTIGITGIHASPSKTGNNTETVTEVQCPDPCDGYNDSDCEQVYFRHWTSTLTGRTCDQVITVTSNEPPVITGVPDDIAIACGMLPTPPVVTATDINGNNLPVSYSETINGSGCSYTVTRKWTVTDDCGTEITEIQIITVIDNTPPVISEPGDDETIYCSAEPQFTPPTATDDCSNNPTVVVVSDVTTPGACAGSYTRTITWKAIDACQNSSGTVSQTITSIDNMAPVLNGTPEDAVVEVSCYANVPAAAEVTATDNCDATVEVISTETESNQGSNCNNTITRTWTAQDLCGNSVSFTQVIYVNDVIAPVLFGIPADETIICGEEISDAIVSAIDNCSQELAVTLHAETIELACGYLFIRTWSVNDNCGNESTAQQTITVIDNVAPVLHGVPTDVNAECTEIPAPAIVTATDNCDENVGVEYSQTGSIEGCNATLIRTWTATDACGNTVIATQTISVGDSTDPELHGIPADALVSCSDELPEIANVTATDNCDNYVNISYSESSDGIDCGYVVSRTWTATDDCGNTTSATQLITVTDSEAPSVNNEPEDLTVECGEEIPAYIPDWTDNCDTDLELSAISSISYVGCNQVINSSWFATDNCGNTTVVSRSVTILDTTDPEFTFVPANFSAGCDEELDLGDATAIDNCDNDVTISVSVEQFGGNCSYSLVRTFVATDDCGNTATAQQIIEVTDASEPEFTFVPTDGVFSCEAFHAEGFATAIDNCSEPVVNYSDVEGSIPGGLCGYRITRTWTAVDACGNTATAVTVYDVYDNAGPVFDQTVANISVECESEIPAYAVLTATDACGDANVVRTETILESDECGNQVILVSYVATDACGNESYTSYMITVYDETAPVLSSLPQDLSLGCDDEAPAAAVLTATDNCGGLVEVFFEETVSGGGTPGGESTDCGLLTPVRPANNPCGYPYDWAMAMFAMPNAHKYYTVSSGQFMQYPNGTIHIIATMNNAINPANGFYVDVEFVNGKNWAAWSTQNFITGFKADCGGIAANHTQWMYYLMNNNNSTLVGFGAYTGSHFQLTHAPSNKYFGFQLGDGANNYNGANDGFGGWFSYSGTFVLNGQQVGNVTSGAGDFAFELNCCDESTITRCWTAVDCSGNVTQHCQTITFGNAPNGSPLAPEISSDAIGKIYTSVSVYPVPAVNQATFVVKAVENGRLTLNIIDLTGSKVASVMNTKVDAGQEYRMTYDASNLANGIYMYQMYNGSSSEMGRIIISK